jgi:murein DD-endopeptidase
MAPIALIGVLILNPSFDTTGPADQVRLAKSVLPVQLQVPFVAPPFTAEGRTGLAYELHLTSFRSIELELTQVDVFATEDPSRSLLTLAGPDLLKCLLRPGRPSDIESPEVLRGGDFAVVFLWITADPGLPLPPSLAHRATFRRVLPDASKREYTAEGGVARIPSEPPIVLHPPLPSGRWLMANGPSMLGDHRLFLHVLDGAASNTQRFASDWMLLGSDGRLVKDDPRENRGWHSYGVPVLAVADAVVVDVADSIPENVPLSEERAVPNKRETMTGNYVVLKLAEHRFAFYGHLRPGSLLVQAGDRVRTGQELGRIGNSGSSDAPHLHFHVADNPDPLSGEGVPFSFRSFAVLDVLEVPFWERILAENLPWEQAAGLEPELREAEMPLGEAIIEFR